MQENEDEEGFDFRCEKGQASAAFIVDPTQQYGTDQFGIVGEIKLANGALQSMATATAALVVSALVATSF